MNIIKTELPGVLIIEPQVHGDNRGWFAETYSYADLKNGGLDVTFVQDNHSMSAAVGTLRGLHFQNNPKAQSKLVRCTRGRLLDAIVDIRKDSPSYKKWITVELSEENKKMVFVPKGFAHGFLTLAENTEIQYKVDEYYSPEHDRGIRYNDPEIGVDWGDVSPVLSAKDTNSPFLKDSDCNF